MDADNGSGDQTTGKQFPQGSRLYIRFDASQNEPEFMRIFMENGKFYHFQLSRYYVVYTQLTHFLLPSFAGGSISAAAVHWDTDFAVTGSEQSVVAHLKKHSLHQVEIEIPRADVSLSTNSDATVPCICIPAETRMNVSTSRVGAAINGTLVTTVAGQGSDHLFNIARPAKHYQVGLVYASWAAHAASIGISNARFVGVPGRRPARGRAGFAFSPAR